MGELSECALNVLDCLLFADRCAVCTVPAQRAIVGAGNIKYKKKIQLMTLAAGRFYDVQQTRIAWPPAEPYMQVYASQKCSLCCNQPGRTSIPIIG